jgi:hypothetical protein
MLQHIAFKVTIQMTRRGFGEPTAASSMIGEDGRDFQAQEWAREICEDVLGRFFSTRMVPPELNAELSMFVAVAVEVYAGKLLEDGVLATYMTGMQCRDVDMGFVRFSTIIPATKKKYFIFIYYLHFFFYYICSGFSTHAHGHGQAGVAPRWRAVPRGPQRRSWKGGYKSGKRQHDRP